MLWAENFVLLGDNYEKSFVYHRRKQGGHIYPALAVADKLKEKEIDVVFVGSRHRMEKDLIPKSGYRFLDLDILPFRSLKSAF